MSEIGKLLEKLRPLDRNLYDNLKLMQAALGRMDLLCADDVFGDHVQGEVQRAIIGRGWPIILSFDCDPDHPETWEAEICNGEVNGLLGRANGLSPCVVVLDAYISCLGGQP